MLFSRPTQYAIRTILYVASVPTDTPPVRVQAIAQALHVPAPSLAKVVQHLVRRGLLVSHKGPRGGVTLAEGTPESSLRRIVETVEGGDLTQECIMGLPGCSNRGTHCPLHDQWREIRGQMLDMLSADSVRNVAQLTRNGRSVLGRPKSTRTGAARRAAARR